MQKTLDKWNDEKFDDFGPEVQEMIEGMLGVFQTAVEHKEGFCYVLLLTTPCHAAFFSQHLGHFTSSNTRLRSLKMARIEIRQN